MIRSPLFLCLLYATIGAVVNNFFAYFLNVNIIKKETYDYTSVRTCIDHPSCFDCLYSNYDKSGRKLIGLSQLHEIDWPKDNSEVSAPILVPSLPL